MWRFRITDDIQIVLHMSANISYKSLYMKLLMLRNHDRESISGCSKYNSGFAKKAWACTLSNGHCTVWSGLSSPELRCSMHISHQIRCWTSLASILALQRFSYLQERSLLITSVPQYPFLYFTYLYTTLFHFQQFLTIYCGLASRFHCFFLNSQV